MLHHYVPQVINVVIALPATLLKYSAERWVFYLVDGFFVAFAAVNIGLDYSINLLYYMFIGVHM